MKIPLALAWIAVAALGLCLVNGCDKQVSLAGTWEYEETNRIKSPDSLVKAVIVEADAGATTSTVTYVFFGSNRKNY